MEKASCGELDAGTRGQGRALGLLRAEGEARAERGQVGPWVSLAGT